MLLNSIYKEQFGNPISKESCDKYPKLGEQCCLKAGKFIKASELKSTIDKDLYPCYGGNGLRGYIDHYSHEGQYPIIGRQGALCGNVNFATGKFYATEHAVVVTPNRVMDHYWLYHCLIRLKLNRFATGAAQPGLAVSKLEKIHIEIPSIEQQQQFSNIANQVKKSKATLQAMIKKLELLKKAKFKEMFGKAIAINNKWRKTQLGTCCEINPKKPNDIADDCQCSFIPMASVGEHGEIDATCIKTYGEVKKGFTYFAENDVLFAKITPCMENGKGCIAHELKNNIGFGSTEFHVLRPLHNLVNSGWIYFLTSSKEFRKIAELNMTGSAGQKRVPSSFLEQYQFYLPPIALQNKFVAYINQIDKIEHSLQSALDKLTGEC